MRASRGLLLAVTCAAVGLSGCGYADTGEIRDVEVRGKVQGPDGGPITGVNVLFHPMSPGAALAGFPLKSDGTFAGKIKEGAYTYYLVPASETDKRGEAVLAKLPANYKAADEKRSLTVRGGAVELKW